jgi:hypothetical protein
VNTTLDFLDVKEACCFLPESIARNQLDEVGAFLASSSSNARPEGASWFSITDESVDFETDLCARILSLKSFRSED